MNYFYIGLFLMFGLVLVLGAVVFIYLMDELGNGRKTEGQPENTDGRIQDAVEEIVEEEKRLASFDEWMKERDEKTD